MRVAREIHEPGQPGTGQILAVCAIAPRGRTQRTIPERVSPSMDENRKVRIHCNRSGNAWIVVLIIASLFGSGCGLFRRGDDDALTPGADPEDLARAVEWTVRQALQAPNEPYWPHHLAELQLRGGNGDAAEEALHDALERDPRYAPSLSLLSSLLYQDARYSEGVELLSAASMDSFPRNEAIVLAAGLALHREALGESGLALETLAPYQEELDWERFGSVPTYLELRGDQFQEAGPVAERALGARPDAVNLNNHGISLLLTGDPERARDEFQRAHALDPELPGPLYNLAIVERFYFFDDVAAQEYFERYAVLSEEDPDGLRGIFETGAQSRVEEEVVR
jgi:tetratricopeptide (TPR) repeat protein